MTLFEQERKCIIYTSLNNDVVITSRFMIFCEDSVRSLRHKALISESARARWRNWQISPPRLITRTHSVRAPVIFVLFPRRENNADDFEGILFLNVELNIPPPPCPLPLPITNNKEKQIHIRMLYFLLTPTPCIQRGGRSMTLAPECRKAGNGENTLLTSMLSTLIIRTVMYIYKMLMIIMMLSSAGIIFPGPLLSDIGDRSALVNNTAVCHNDS